MSEPNLFGLDPRELTGERPAEAVRPGAPRLQTPDRAQVRMQTASLDELVPAGHRVRLFWRFVEGLDLSALLEPIKAREGGPGRPPIDPRILLTLWLYATSKGVGSATEIDELCRTHDVYRWVCGGVSVNYHTISDFRSQQGEAFGEVLQQLLATLMHSGIVKVKRVAQDGMRVRASAGAASFHREPTLEECLEEATKRVAKAARSAKDPHRNRRKQAAQKRAADDRLARAEKALKELPKARTSKRSADEKANARVSLTDPEARVMHMSDGGYRPAYNVQIATDTASRVALGVLVTNCGTDNGQALPMLDEVERNTGKLPRELLVDGGFVNLDAITSAAGRGVTVFAPVPTPRQEGVDPHAPKPTDTKAVADWRRRMATDPAKETYKDRAATAETVNGDLKAHRTLGSLSVRGTAKVLAVSLLNVLTYDLVRAIALGAVT